jgi:ribosome-binding protein aMBF1 (putative translation factor)
METPHVYSDLDRERDRRARLGLRPSPIDAAAARYVQERLGRAIRHRRRMLDLTLQDLAVSCGVTFQQVHKYESGLCSLSASQLWAIAQALNVDVAYFYESLSARDVWRTDEPQPA